jgi:hypothetical protein
MIMLDGRGGAADSVPMGADAGDVFAAPSGNSGWDNSTATTPSDLDDDIPF